ncbi:UNKNOWN [Stylonychia lemnae]|uniref:EF-hand domain-containing protein n=1 Tax=Stylonychia lemnae TaxID=5949 RepID=A0A078A411_STYLE|nr:UNKNOWN [Stylonychia lemnae]|eukprot:CDW77008.1 UNKNOWN [Stylonychia lemnae]
MALNTNQSLKNLVQQEHKSINQSEKLVLLAQFFQFIASHEKQMEIIREILFEQKELINNDLYLWNIYNHFDQGKKGFLTQEDFSRFFMKTRLQEEQQTHHNRYLDHLVEFYSSDENPFKLQFKEFATIFLPKYKYRISKPLIITEEYLQHNISTQDNQITQEIEHCLARVLERELEFMIKRRDFMLQFEKSYSDSKGIDYTKLFIDLDSSLSGLINTDKMLTYLMRLPQVFSSRDAEAIVNRIQKDKTSICGFNFLDFKKLFQYKNQIAEPVIIREYQESIPLSRQKSNSNSNLHSAQRQQRNSSSRSRKNSTKKVSKFTTLRNSRSTNEFKLGGAQMQSPTKSGSLFKGNPYSQAMTYKTSFVNNQELSNSQSEYYNQSTTKKDGGYTSKSRSKKRSLMTSQSQQSFHWNKSQLQGTKNKSKKLFETQFHNSPYVKPQKKPQNYTMKNSTLKTSIYATKSFKTNRVLKESTNTFQSTQSIPSVKVKEYNLSEKGIKQMFEKAKQQIERKRTELKLK